ncbi:MAG TPA: hypothetical protein VMT99_02035 [Candidatus Paceibacterota bacterium]|nr:hypothetical protein [Candidatus Paceibacterota bacterium]
MPKNPEFGPKRGSELTEKDRMLNELAYKFSAVTNKLNGESFRVIKIVDSDETAREPGEHAEVNTDSLGNVKEQLALLHQLVIEIEKAGGIIDAELSPRLLEGNKGGS